MKTTLTPNIPNDKASAKKIELMNNVVINIDQHHLMLNS